MTQNLTLRRVVEDPSVSLLLFVLVLVVAPWFGVVAMMVGAAGVLSLLLAGSPERFRGRNGSLTTARRLAAAMWIGAAAVAVLAVLGQVSG